MNQQLYNMDFSKDFLGQVNELIRVGLIKIPDKNILESKGEMSYPLEVINNGSGELCMKGKIRTKENCPKCKGNFSFSVHVGFVCSKCLTTPEKFFVDIYEKGYGRLRIYSDKQGHSLDSYQRSTRVLESIRYEIDQHIFDYSNYVSTDLKSFRFENKIEKWYQSKSKEVEKGNLAESYTEKLRCYIDKYYLLYFKGMDVRDLRTYNIQSFYEQLSSELSLKYIKNILNALENFFKTLQRLDLINKKPSFPVITVERRTPKWVDYETQQKIIDSIPVGDKPIIQFLALQGVRPGEAMVLKVKDINLNNLNGGFLIIARTLSMGKVKERVKSKVVKPRLVNPELIPMLRELCKDKLPEAFIFINPRTKKPYSKPALSRVWDNVRKALKLDINLYEATRHSLASIASSAGVPLQSIQDVLCHTDIRTTLK